MKCSQYIVAVANGEPNAEIALPPSVINEKIKSRHASNCFVQNLDKYPTDKETKLIQRRLHLEPYLHTSKFSLPCLC